MCVCKIKWLYEQQRSHISIGDICLRMDHLNAIKEQLSDSRGRNTQMAGCTRHDWEASVCEPKNVNIIKSLSSAIVLFTIKIKNVYPLRMVFIWWLLLLPNMRLCFECAVASLRVHIVFYSRLFYATIHK